jgi:glucosylceramidase
VTVSTDGTRWSTAVAGGVGSGQFTTADLRGAPIRFVWITLTTAAPDNWWSVADVRAYTR